MENQNPKQRQRISTEYHSQFNPINSIGTLLFFDYYKNKFGLISEVRCALDIKIGNVKISESGLGSQKRLNNGEIVTFILNRGYNGYFATDVKSIRELGLKTFSDFIELINIDDIEIVLDSIAGNDLKSLDGDEKKLIFDFFVKNSSPKAWSILIKIDNPDLIGNFVDNVINALSDEEKILYLKEGYNEKLLQNIFSFWTDSNKSVLNKFLVHISSYWNLNSFTLPENFIQAIIRNDWTFDEIWKISLKIKHSEISNKVLSLFTFKNYDSIERLQKFLPLAIIDEKYTNQLREIFTHEKLELSGKEIFQIFQELREYKIIQDENELMELLKVKNLTYETVSELFIKLSDNCNLTDLEVIISFNNITSKSFSERFDILKNNISKVKISKFILSTLLNPTNVGEDSTSILLGYSNVKNLINFIKETSNPELTNHFLEISYKLYSKVVPLAIFELAVSSENTIIRDFSYGILFFQNSKEILSFLDEIKILNLNENTKLLNKPLSGFIDLMNSTENFELTEACKTFFTANQGIVQSIAVKYLVYQYYKKHLDRIKLLELLNSYKWTEISALIVKTFIEESNFDEKFVLDKLNKAFFKHFDVLSNSEISDRNFYYNFGIHDILKWCNDRKHYKIIQWKGNNLVRDYVQEIDFKENLYCYCEGRPWKKKSMWDSQTNKQSDYEYYWCKSGYCAQRNDVVEMGLPYFDWTLSEISFALGINIEKLVFSTLAGWANRMNQIIDRLYCRSCKEILRPVPFRPRSLGYYAVPLFHCINDQCQNFNISIRFTHCLNGKCKSHVKSEPLDSRDCISCNPSEINHAGLKCNYCGQGCPSCSGERETIVVQDEW